VLHPELPRPHVHPMHERLLAARVPPSQERGHVVARGQQQCLQRLALAEKLPTPHGGGGLTRVAVGPVGRLVSSGDPDLGSRAILLQGVVAQDDERGHDLGHAGDRGRQLGSARAEHPDSLDRDRRLPLGGPGQAVEPSREGTRQAAGDQPQAGSCPGHRDRAKGDHAAKDHEQPPDDPPQPPCSHRVKLSTPPRECP
jgi:hypothetical protein